MQNYACSREGFTQDISDAYGDKFIVNYKEIWSGIYTFDFCINPSHEDSVKAEYYEGYMPNKFRI